MPPKLVFSEYQKNIFRDIHNGIGHTVVIARAGSAKTSSLVEGAKYLPKGKRALFCAFNKSIQEELKSKLPSYVECLTLHSLGFRAIKKRFPNVELDYDKCWNIVSSFIDNDTNLVASICKAVDLCKATLTDTPIKIDELIAKYDIDTCDYPLPEFIGYVSRTLRLCKEETKIIDFNDMIWFCFVYRIDPGKYDFVFIDEAHDLNRAQIELALSACKPDGRVIAVIDPRQAIYSWRGADTEVLDNLRARLNPRELYLPICYRCPKKVVFLAQTIVPDIQSYINAIDGEIIDLHIDKLHEYAKPGAYVISRLNAPLIKYCLFFLKNGIPSNILGRDIGTNLLNIVKKSKKKNIKSFLEWLTKWEKQEKEILSAKYPKASTEVISDKTECLRILCEDISSIQDLKNNINNLFKDNEEKNIVLFSSAHRIKGKEANDVFVLTHTLRYSSEEEDNIRYVSFTRSKQKLYLVYKDKKYKQFNNPETKE
jgi:DNA helicase II / ATP-dependent DNA helicase PcrA